MLTFILSLILLVAGYLVYGAIVERVFTIDPARATPCYTLQDGVDYTPMSGKKIFLIQFLNIAGTGPIFGAIQGILFGPAAYLWIVLGCIFGGAVHDYLAGMLSLRRDGASLPELVGTELGSVACWTMRLLAMILMVLVGAVFATTPAGLLASMTTGWAPVTLWVVLIFVYYFLATLLPIDKLIGRIYPLFGLALLVMAGGILVGIFTHGGALPEITDAFADHHPASTIPLFPGLCITIACGAVSGFHATQSPMMARCMTTERLGRPVFYGAMITEGIVAMIWAAAAIKFANGLDIAGATPYEKLYNLLTDGGTHGVNPALVVNTICHSWLGTVGAILAILGVVAAPITSGDTAFRCARLIMADFLKIKQNTIAKRLLIALPIFAIAIILMFVDFSILWRYFAWTNQTLSVFTLWTITVWLARHQKCYWVTLFPALFMTMVCTTYILIAPEGFHLRPIAAYTLATVATATCLTLFIRYERSAIS